MQESVSLEIMDSKSQTSNTSDSLVTIVGGPYFIPKFIAQRRKYVLPFKELDMFETLEMLDELEAGVGDMDEYKGTLSGEPFKRPIPHLFKKGTYKALNDIAEELYPIWFKTVLNMIKAAPFTVERDSRIGYPDFGIYPEGDEKVRILTNYVSTGILQGNFDDDAYTINNLRLQNESINKEREFYFIDDNGVAYLEKVNWKYRYDKYTNRILSRPRLVSNKSVENAGCKQYADTLINNVYGRSPLIHHDMFHYPPYFNCPSVHCDVEHFERKVNEVSEIRAKNISSNYLTLQKWLNDQPVLVVADDWSRCFKISPSKGYTFQYGSGDSAVSPIAKEVVSLVFLSFIQQELNIEITEQVIMSYLDASLFKNLDYGLIQFGDDHILLASTVVKLERIFSFFSMTLGSKKEDDEVFLGFKRSSDGIYYLTKKSCFNNEMRPERPPSSIFRPYAHYGFYERTKTYREFGDEKVREYLTFRDEIMRRYINMASFKLKAAKEKAIIGRLNEKQSTGKEYLMTQQEKIDANLVTLMPKEISKRISLLLLGKIYV